MSGITLRKMVEALKKFQPTFNNCEVISIGSIRGKIGQLDNPITLHLRNSDRTLYSVAIPSMEKDANRSPVLYKEEKHENQ